MWLQHAQNTVRFGEEDEDAEREYAALEGFAEYVDGCAARRGVEAWQEAIP